MENIETAVNLIIDIGNTAAKCVLLAAGRPVAETRMEVLDVAALDAFLAGYDPHDLRAIVSSTRGAVPEWVEAVRIRTAYCLEFTPATPVPLRNAYRTPETLGRDRLAAAVGATVLCPGRNVLIVDAGTALTLDWVTKDGVYQGGCISAGLRMRLHALHEHTACLPLCDPDSIDDSTPLFGGTTEEALVLGALHAICFEVEGYASRLREKNDDLCVIFTGGDAKYFDKRIKNTIFADRNPVICGLNRILEYNVHEEYLD